MSANLLVPPRVRFASDVRPVIELPDAQQWNEAPEEPEVGPEVVHRLTRKNSIGGGLTSLSRNVSDLTDRNEAQAKVIQEQFDVLNGFKAELLETRALIESQKQALCTQMLLLEATQLYLDDVVNS